MAGRKSVDPEREAQRLARMLEYEHELWARGHALVAGLDEVGRGCIAGPVVAAAVVLPPGAMAEGINDSKLLSAKKRAALAEAIKRVALDWAIAAVSPACIDAVNILQATRLAMGMAVRGLNPMPDYLLVDAVRLPDVALPQQAIIKGDQRSMSIAAASILAKVERDAMMARYGAIYAGYGFERHAGYGTAEHRRAIEAQGPCPLHRMSFAPLKGCDEAAATVQPPLF
ncbi:MAG: ribonuclease HII [Syntrophomonadaceae bacterium]|nr:ribonuclease HII [Syntrophomonadaceae bacterium]